MPEPNARATAAAYLAEHSLLEQTLSDALNDVISLVATDLGWALGITLRRRAKSAQPHVQLEGALHHAAQAVDEAEARVAFSKIAHQLRPREVGQKPSVAELRSLEQTLSGLINDALYEMPKDPIETIGGAVSRSCRGPIAAVPSVGPVA